MERVNDCTIIAKTWRQRYTNNTYHSVKVLSHNKTIGHVPFQYGYGDHWKQTAFTIMVNAKLYENNQYDVFLQDLNSKLTSIVVKVQRKKDL